MPSPPTPPVVEVDWTQVPWGDVRPMHPSVALRVIMDQLPLLVWNDMTLEGTSLTLDDILLLVEGGDPASAEVSDLDVAKATGLIEAYRALIALLQNDSFDLEKDTMNRLAKDVARAEVIDPGVFRCDSNVGGGGHVRLTTGHVVSGIDNEIMSQSYNSLISQALPVLDPRQAAMYYYAAVVRWQLWFDGNKRAGRLGMLGHLVAHGYAPPSVPAKDEIEFHKSLDVLFAAGDATRLCALIAASPACSASADS